MQKCTKDAIKMHYADANSVHQDVNTDANTDSHHLHLHCAFIASFVNANLDD